MSPVFVWVLFTATQAHTNETFVGVFHSADACEHRKAELLRDPNIAALSVPGTGLVWTCSKVPLK